MPPDQSNEEFQKWISFVLEGVLSLCIWNQVLLGLLEVVGWCGLPEFQKLCDIFTNINEEVLINVVIHVISEIIGL
jgi:hypothetical protein